jgi:O-antigen/teichoic acid export membrane protein
MLKSTGAVLARNSLYNFVTQILVSVVAFASIPAIVQGLGEEVFGILSIIWMVVGYFSVLDLGVGQASVKFLSEQIARSEYEEANSTIWVSVLVGAIVGGILSLLVLLLIPFLLGQFVTIPPALLAETHRSFYWIALAIPFVMLQGAFRAVPMAVQRFDLFNLMLGASGLLQWGGSLLLVLLGKGLFEIALLTLGIRVTGACVAYWIAHVLFPELSFNRVTKAAQTAKRLVGFGGWLTISQFVSPVARYLDRAFVVSYHSLKMFTFYSVPFEAMSRLQVIPLSLSTTLFPAMSERESIRGEAKSFPLYMRAINLTVVVMLPVSIGLTVFSRQILQLWLGGDFPALSNSVFKILTAAVFFQAVCYVPLTSLQAMGRPDVAAKYYMVEIPFYIGLCFLLIPPFGVEGAAWAYCIRMVLSTLWFLWVAHRNLGSPPISLKSVKKSLGLNFVLLLCLLLAAHIVDGVLGQVLLLSCIAGGYAVAVWLYCLDGTEREAIQKLMFVRIRSAS